jgi:thymidylate synthase
MQVIRARNVHQALPLGLEMLNRSGVRRESRNGPVIAMDDPVTTLTEKPEERVLFWPERDANPFFHLYECLWMMAGRNDVASVAKFVKRMATFSDDGKTLHGAYGHRWRYHFGVDQINSVLSELKSDPESRRCVIQMWDAKTDQGRKGKDVPCNTQLFVAVGADGRLNLTVLCRSNDAVWGAHGANAVHFSFLQEFIARSLGRETGRMWQVSNNYHLYLGPVSEQVASLAENEYIYSDPYTTGVVSTYPIMQSEPKQWMEDLLLMLDENVIIGLRDPFFRRVAVPMLKAHDAYRNVRDTDRFTRATEIVATQCSAPDWSKAALEWLERRREATLRAADDGVSYE